MNKIGKTIKIYRELAGVRQLVLAKRLGVSPNYISLIENGKREPSLKFLGKLASEFKVPIASFFWEFSNTNSIDDPKLLEATNQINDLFLDILKQKLSTSINNE